MKPIFQMMLVLCMTALVQAATPEEELTTFIDDFFTRFAELSAAMREGRQEEVGMSIIVHANDNFVPKSRGGAPTSGEVPPVDLVSKLWQHGPESWRVENMRVAGDVARANIVFTSVKDGQADIPFAFRFIRERDRWLFLKATDKRPPKEALQDEDVALPAERELKVQASGAATLKEYLDYLVDNRGPIDVRNPAKLYPAAKKISDEVARLWGDDPAARRARNEATTKILLMDMNAWEVIEEATEGDRWTATVAITLGERNPMAAYMKTKPKVKIGAMKTDKGWQLISYEQMR